MVPAISQASLYPDSEQAEELSDFPSGQESNRTREEAIYSSRPSSRLGFNRTILSTTSPEVSSDSGAVQWSHSLFQNADTNTMEHVTLMPVGTDEKRDRLSSNDPSTPVSAYNSVSNDCIGSPVAPRKSPKTSPPPVSRLCFPFVTTSSRRNKPPPPPPPIRHKYSCFPSLMSPASAGRPLPKHQRHNYRQHGYSRLALQQIKWFWSTREEVGYNMYHHGALPYEGLPPKGDLPLPSNQSSGPQTPGTSIFPATISPLTIHPRRGDISALRDPYCVHIDRCFAGVPTWTIGKTLWMHELHVAAEERNADIGHTSNEDMSDAESESELEMSASTGFSDDSDATLVESESETDLPNFLVNKQDVGAKGQFEQARDLEVGSSSTAISQLSFHFSSLHVGHWFRSVNLVHTKTSSGFSGHTQRGRKTNWYRRWELLVELSRAGRDRGHIFFEPVAPAPSLDFGSRASNMQQFHLAHKQTEPDEDDAWNARLEDIEA